MTPEQKAAYVFAQAVCAMAEIEGMKAENIQCTFRDADMTYMKKQFMAVIEKYGIHHNAVLTEFEDR